jgi:hypothetical protein
MHQNFFAMKVSPFRMAPDAKVIFQTAQHLESILGLMYTILCRKGLAVLTGDAGNANEYRSCQWRVSGRWSAVREWRHTCAARSGGRKENPYWRRSACRKPR